ncbi:uncharacterized protein LOC110023838 [Phalaenopsis equestris]|uniref:uncharacterized protein LOC110023838 n=1 Tax=Phalaenopsis equestris TaxID=78828 RepID=UPI0009E33EBB|nr:uncharacterized protein LOC110023838 [Phalaenopsis equestris]
MTALRRTPSSSGSIPFLWEHLPGISKVIHDQTNAGSSSPRSTPPLPPPPCSTASDSSSPLARRIIYVPLPPCPFMPTHELLPAQKGMKKRDDPFLAAFMECTKCNYKKEDGKKRKSVKEKVMGMRVFSCKYDVGVRKDVMIRVHGGRKFMEVREE